MRKPWRSADLKGSSEPERLLPGQARDHERVSVLVVNLEFDRVSEIGFVPGDFNDASDCEWLRERPGVYPSTAEKKQEAFADLSAICQDDFSPQRWRPSAPRFVAALEG